MKTPTLYCEDGTEVELPFKFQICSICEGRGTSSAYLGAFTQSDMDEEGPEFMEDYFDGHYDRPCDECGGSGKVKVVDRARVNKKHLREWNAQCRAEAECESEARHERMMMGGLDR